MRSFTLQLYWAQNRCIWCQDEFREGDEISATVIYLHTAEPPDRPEHLGDYIYSTEALQFKKHCNGYGSLDFSIQFHSFHNPYTPRRHFVKKVICAHKSCLRLCDILGLPDDGEKARDSPFSSLWYLAGASSRKSLEILVSPAMQFAFPPSADEESRRRRYTQEELAKNLHRSSIARPSQLPYELWLEVSKHLVRECAAVTTLERLRAVVEGKKHIDFPVDLSGTKPVYASYMKIGGRYYVKWLQHTPPPATRSEGTYIGLLYRPEKDKMKGTLMSWAAKPQTSMDLYAAHDHIGIRQVFLVPSKDYDKWAQRQPRLSGVWWRKGTVGNATGTLPRMVVINTTQRADIITLKPKPRLRDVIKLGTPGSSSLKKNENKTHDHVNNPNAEENDGNFGGGDSSPGYLVLPPSFSFSWSIPPSFTRPLKIVDLSLDNTGKNWSALTSYSNTLMATFELNSPNTVGYSALFDAENILAIITHKDGDHQIPPTSTYMDIEIAASSSGWGTTPPHWVYFPVDSHLGEYVTHMLYRRRETPNPLNTNKFHVTSVVFVTDHGRVCEFGSHDRFWGNFTTLRVATFTTPLKEGSTKGPNIFYNKCDMHPNRRGSQLLAFEETPGMFITSFDAQGHIIPDPASEIPLPRPIPDNIMIPDFMDTAQPGSGTYKQVAPAEMDPSPVKPMKSIVPSSRYSHASLHNVKTIEVAYGVNYCGDQIVTGLLFGYKDGRHETVGSFRPDRVISGGKIEIDGEGDYLLFTFLGTGGGMPGKEAESKWVGEVSVVSQHVELGQGDVHVGSLGLEGGEGDGICLRAALTGTLAWCVFGWKDMVRWFPDVETRLGKMLG